jgi:hypothetical protein
MLPNEFLDASSELQENLLFPYMRVGGGDETNIGFCERFLISGFYCVQGGMNAVDNNSEKVSSELQKYYC